MRTSKNGDWAVHAAEDQSLFREVNERLRDLNEAFEHAARNSEFICECADRNCVEHVVLTLAEYEQVRLVPTHFIVLPSMKHVFIDVERIVEERESYFVVEKYGDAGITAVKLDPRSLRAARPG
jgi:hypothetical protein